LRRINMSMKKFWHKCGFTESRRTELSDILYDTGVVSSKEYQEENDNRALGLAMGNLALGMAMSEDEAYNINLKGQKTSFELDDEELYNKFEVGDNVKIGYREQYKFKVDYVPPNFDQKQDIDKWLSDYIFVSAEKILTDNK
jgi:hypothetical protein